MKLLVVEDDAGIRGLLVTLLSRRDAEVVCARDGESALQLLRGEQFSAVVLDLMIPRPNGFELLREIKARVPELLPRTIVVTAAADSTIQDLDRTELGGFFSKPFSIDDLVCAVFRCASRGPRPESISRPAARSIG